MRVEKLSNVAMANFQLPKPDIDLHPHTWFDIRSILRLCHRSSFGRYWALPLKLLPPRTGCSTDTRSLYVWCSTDGSRLSSMTNKIHAQSYSSAPFCYLHHNIQPLYKSFILYKWKIEKKNLFMLLHVFKTSTTSSFKYRYQHPKHKKPLHYHSTLLAYISPTHFGIYHGEMVQKCSQSQKSRNSQEKQEEKMSI